MDFQLNADSEIPFPKFAFAPYNYLALNSLQGTRVSIQCDLMLPS